MSLKDRLAQVEVNKAIEAKLATGKFKDTGEKYTAEKATADHTNSKLRMVAVIENNKLNWKAQD